MWAPRGPGRALLWGRGRVDRGPARPRRRRRAGAVRAGRRPRAAHGREQESFHRAQAVFDDYIASFAGGNARTIRRMIDFWGGAGAFDRLPEAVTTALVQATAANIND